MLLLLNHLLQLCPVLLSLVGVLLVHLRHSVLVAQMFMVLLSAGPCAVLSLLAKRVCVHRARVMLVHRQGLVKLALQLLGMVR